MRGSVMPRTSLSPQSGNEKGFTLVELIVVIAIMGIMITIAAISMTDYIRRSRLQEAARNLDGDLETIRNTARVRQIRNVVVTFTMNGGTLNGYRAFVDANDNLAFDAGEEGILNRSFTGGVQLAVTSTTPGAVAPYTTVRYSALGTLRDGNGNREITISMTSEQKRQFLVTVFTTGVTRVMRSEDGGATWPTRAW